MKSRRPYSSPVRAERAAATRRRILESARDLFADRATDFTLERVASAAGVSVQTVLRNYGSREELIVAAVGTIRDAVAPVRIESFASTGDAVSYLFDDYEEIGDRVMRVLAEEHRVPGFAETAARGREMHRAWVEAAFASGLRRYRGRARTSAVTAVVAATDVYVWHLLRRDLQLDRRAAESVVTRLVEGALSSSGEGKE